MAATNEAFSMNEVDVEKSETKEETLANGRKDSEKDEKSSFSSMENPDGVKKEWKSSTEIKTRDEKKVNSDDASSMLDGIDVGVGAYVVSDDKKARMAWDNQVQFLLACIAYAVGLGNIWRFPYLAQTYGGGAFLIPYLLMLVIEGIPLFYLELAVGQRIRQGAIGVWKQFHPYLMGIGVASMVVSFTVGLYYNVIIAWCFWYLCNSFTDPLPYATCPPNENNTGFVEVCEKNGTTDYFWYVDTLKMSSGIDETGDLVWWILICLILAWSLIWVTMIRGIESSGKVMYVTATLPYVVLIIFLGRGLSLRGSGTGVSYLFTPDIQVLAKPEVWLDAATQIFFSLGIGFGGVIAFASYNPKKQDCQRDSLIIALTNSFTSIFASIVIFAVLGYKATIQFESCLDGNIEILLDTYDLPEGTINYDNYDDMVLALNNTENWKGENITVDNLNLANCDLNEILSEASQGTGLAFIVFTEAIVNMPGSPVWSVLFFLMLLSLGLGSMFGTVEGVVTPLFDIGLKIPKVALTGIISLISCVIGLMFCTQSGNYWLEIFNSYAGSIPLLIIVFFELVVVIWGYGIKRFDEDLEWMIGRPKKVGGWILHYYFRICWTFISPVVLGVVFVAYLYVFATGELKYNARNLDGSVEPKIFPWYALLVIILLIALPAVCIPIVWIYRFVRSKLGSEEYDGILAEKTWGDVFRDIQFWKNISIYRRKNKAERDSF